MCLDVQRQGAQCQEVKRRGAQQCVSRKVRHSF
jgi:hypothetical protein